MMRRLVLLLLSGSAAMVAVLAWLLFGEGGLAAAARLAESAAGGRLAIEAPGGRLAGPLRAGRIAWRGDGWSLIIDEAALDWSPATLLDGRFSVRRLAAQRVRIDIVPTPGESPVPASLALPVAVDVARIAISRLEIGALAAAEDVQAAFAADAEALRLSDVNARLGRATLRGGATLGVSAPLPIEASATLAGRYEERELGAELAAAGTLARIVVSARATAGGEGTASLVLTPFARFALAEVGLDLANIDPAAWVAGAPRANLVLAVRARPEGAGGDLGGEAGFVNRRPGPLDRGLLPLEKGELRFVQNVDSVRLDDIALRLAGRGTLAGTGAWAAGRLDLRLTAAGLDAAGLDSRLRPTRLAGPLVAALGSERQALSLQLADERFRLGAEIAHAAGAIDLARLELAAGDSRLSARGKLQAQGGNAIALDGELERFDPSRFVRAPAALINARFSLAGQLQPRVAGRLQYVLRDSSLGGQPLAGSGDLEVDWPRIPRAALSFAAGENRLEVAGGFGEPGMRLLATLAAPRLTLLGAAGSIDGTIALGGSPARPALALDLRAKELAVPGVGRVGSGRLVVAADAAPDGPLQVDLDAGDLAAGETRVRRLALRVEGSRRNHVLRTDIELAGRERIEAALAGAYGADPQPAWSGRIERLRLATADGSRFVALKEPGPLAIAGDGWRLGPLALRAARSEFTVTAEAANRRLAFAAAGRGERLGEVSLRLGAALLDPWTLEREAPWEGALRFDVGDLAWVGELLGDAWVTGGALRGHVDLAGTPAHPLATGAVRGERLAAALPAQGLRLANGTLAARLADDLLTIEQLSFDSLLQTPPRALRVAERELAPELVARPGRIEIGGRVRVDRDSLGDEAALDVRFERAGLFQLPDRWAVVSGSGRLARSAQGLAVRGRFVADAALWELARGGTPTLSDDVRIVGRDGGNGEEAPATLQPPLDLDVEVDLGDHFHFRGFGVESRLAGSVRLQAQGRDLPRASGRIRTRDGRFDAYGQQLAIERGILTFRGLPDNPALDVLAVRKGLPVEAGVSIGGTARKPVVRLVSDPEVPDAEKMSWLVLGHGPEQGGAGDATVLLAAAGSLLGADSGNLVQQLKRGFGLDELGVRQGQIGGGGGRLPSSRVVGSSYDTAATTGNQIFVVGKRLSSNLVLSYDQALGQADSVVRLTLQLSRQLSLIARAGSDNSLDILYSVAFGRSSPGPGSGREGRQGPRRE